jgi:hypothetical protein
MVGTPEEFEPFERHFRPGINGLIWMVRGQRKDAR